MKDPQRLLDHGATPEELRLLRAGAAEEPSPEAKQRLVVALGLGAGVSLPSSPASAAPKPAGTAGSSLATGSELGLKGLIAIASGAVLGAATLTTLLISSEAPPHPRVSSAPSAPVVPKVPSPPAAASAAPKPNIADAPTLTPSATPAPHKPAPSARGGATVPVDSTSIAREIEAIDTVRKLVSQRQASAALSALAQYRKEFPRGALRQEAILLHIEALTQAGRLDAARALGQRFLREHPRTPHEKRVRALLGDAP